MRRLSPASIPLVLALACSGKADTAPPTPPPAPDVPLVHESDADMADADISDEDVGDGGFGSAKKKSKTDPKEEQRKRLAAATKRMKESYAKEAERWTPELKAETQKLLDKKHRSAKAALQAALKGAHRKPGNADRDGSRHPVATMTFLGLKPDMTVFEVGPGSGWYTELLAPTLHSRGKLLLAGYDKKSDDPVVAYFGSGVELMLKTSDPLYSKVETVPNKSTDEYNMGPPESLDMILVVRMTHNIVRSGGFDTFVSQAHKTLKPGGVLGIVQHRAKADADAKKSSEKGYVPQKWLVEQITGAGFKLGAKSEINANKKDTKDYEKGVWTLPPTFAEGDTDKKKYTDIGESDRMTLKFVKPKAPKKK